MEFDKRPKEGKRTEVEYDGMTWEQYSKKIDTTFKVACMLHGTVHVVCCMLYAVCRMPYAVCSMPYAVCCMLYAVCCVLYALCCMLYVAWSIVLSLGC